jgi:hypothetical protein
MKKNKKKVKGKNLMGKKGEQRSNKYKKKKDSWPDEKGKGQKVCSKIPE